VKNCAPYLKKVFENIEKIGTLFDDYKIIIYYDKSTDNTLDILKSYQKENSRLLFYVNKNTVLSFRTHNLAIARNFCLNYVRDKKEEFTYFIMMDFDDVNSKELNIEPLKTALTDKKDAWDGLSFNTYPLYYDIWGLSINPYYFSYNHFNDNDNYYTIIQKYIDGLLKNRKSYLPCISSFNGFSIYKTNMFLNSYYDGRIRLDLIPQKNLEDHMKATKSKLVYKKYHTVDGRFEDCEHRAFHIQASKNNGARLMISPEILFY
jgi:hypothetical protein